MSFSTLAALIAFGAATLALSALVLSESRRKRHDELLLRLRSVLGGDARAQTRKSETDNRVVRWVIDLLWRAGLEPARWQGWTAGSAILAAAGVGALLHGAAGLVYGAALLGVIYALLERRAGARRQLMVEQLPVFIDHLVRAVSTGNTLDTGFMVATAEAREPLRGALDRVTREIRLGGALEEALAQTARIYAMQELRILTLAVTVNRRYGSSIQELLKSVVTMIRRNEAARREFRALTGETRLSAWVLGLMPLAIALFIIATSPGYMSVLWHDPAGRVMLAVAVSLQGVGAFILWRMTRVF